MKNSPLQHSPHLDSKKWLVATVGLDRAPCEFLAGACARTTEFSFCGKPLLSLEDNELLHIGPDMLLADEACLLGGVFHTLISVHDALPNLHIILISKSPDSIDLASAIRSGVWGAICRASFTIEAERAMRAVVRGEFWLSRMQMSRLLIGVQSTSFGDAPRTLFDKAGLTARENMVIQGVLQGYANKEIARALDIAEQTVKIHLHNIFSKLKLRRRVDLFLFCQREVLVTRANSRERMH